MANNMQQIQSGYATTLDEPVSETIMRDLRNVGSKLKVVLLPREDQEGVLQKLRECKFPNDDEINSWILRNI